MRTWTLTMPGPRKVLSQNDRMHWGARSRLVKTWKNDTCVMARHAKVKRCEAIHVRLVLHPATRARHDPDNLAPTVKACIDGLVMAGVIADDDSTRVSHDIAIGTPQRPPVVRLYITERERITLPCMACGSTASPVIAGVCQWCVDAGIAAQTLDIEA